MLGRTSFCKCISHPNTHRFLCTARWRSMAHQIRPTKYDIVHWLVQIQDGTNNADLRKLHRRGIVDWLRMESPDNPWQYFVAVVADFVRVIVAVVVLIFGGALASFAVPIVAWFLLHHQLFALRLHEEHRENLLDSFQKREHSCHFPLLERQCNDKSIWNFGHLKCLKYTFNVFC